MLHNVSNMRHDTVGENVALLTVSMAGIFSILCFGLQQCIKSMMRRRRRQELSVAFKTNLPPSLNLCTAIRFVHAILCCTYVATSMTLAISKIICPYLLLSSQRSVVEILLQFLMIAEFQVLLMEQMLSYFICRRTRINSARHDKKVIMMIIFLIPLAVMVIVFQLPPSEGPIPMKPESEITEIVSRFETIAFESHEAKATIALPRNLSEYQSISNIIHSRLSLISENKKDVINATARFYPQISAQLLTVTDFTQVKKELHLKPTAENILLTKDTELAHSPHETTENLNCWITWPSTSLIATFSLAFCFFLTGCTVCVLEYKILRSVETKFMVSLEEWFAFIGRLFLYLVSALKWIAITLIWFSRSSIYSVYVTTLVTSFLILLIIAPRRSRVHGNIFSKKFLASDPADTVLLCDKSRDLERCCVTSSVGYRSISYHSGTMLQIEEMARSHVSNDVMINQRLSDFVRQRFDNESTAAVTETLSNYPKDLSGYNKQLELEDEGYGVIKPKPYDVVDVAGGLKHLKVNDKKNSSTFEDSDYDEVLDVPASTVQNNNDELSANSTAHPTNYRDTASKRSSAASGSESVGSTVSSAALSSSGIESSEERPNQKYSNLDVAKILHTRKRIRRILHSPPESAVASDAAEEETTNTSHRKKPSSITKRTTYYGTLGRRSKSASKRPPSTSRPLSTGETDYSDTFQARDCATVDTLRVRRDANADSDDHIFTFDARADCLKSRDSDSEGDSIRSSDGFENRRWSRLSSNSQNSDKTVNTPQKGPLKAFKRFVYNNNSPTGSVKGNLSHEEKKAMIQVCVSVNDTKNRSNNNNNNDSKLSESDVLASRGAYDQDNNLSYSCLPTTPVSAIAHKALAPPETHTNSLLRRLSKKSPSRGRDSRRSSLPSQNIYDVRSTSQPASGEMSTRFNYGDGSQKVDIETRVMESVERRDRSQSAKSKTLGKSSSIKRKFLSFTRRRPSEKKSSPKKKDEVATGMNKSLSFSSPQLSVFSVNSAPGGANRTSMAHKLVF